MEVAGGDLEREGLGKLHFDRELSGIAQIGEDIRIAAALLDRGFQILVHRHLEGARVGPEDVGDGLTHPAMPGAFLLAPILRGARVVRDEGFALIPRAVRLGVGVMCEQRDIARRRRLRLDINRALADQAPRERSIGRVATPQVDLATQMLPSGRLHRHQGIDRHLATRRFKNRGLDRALALHLAFLTVDIGAATRNSVQYLFSWHRT